MPSREPELYKDKVEVSLDGRQIFYLFFGSAVIVGMVFVLGVIVGRRVEARGHLDRADTQAAGDPLAALDRLERADHLSFHGALTGTGTPTDVEKAIGEIERRRASPPARPEPSRSDKPVAAPARPEARAEPEAHEAAARPDADARPDKHDDRKIRKREESGDAKGEARSEAKNEAKSDAKSDAKAEGKVRFTLQLSSFQDKTEAEAFLGATRAAGFQPYLTEAEVSGKGTFYRVRLGSFRSLEAAGDAKAEYDKTARKPAQVMRL
ncbi:MAG: SPOR domain-containing protein [Deltaproteobacteria bacterium]|nr:MAG: SPOR domain-containing protein [Deltaproteobacteria bacterium]TMQ06573.1 MAG: SPOR domain-containing protein [Deltaproteobacteria bacterium]